MVWIHLYQLTTGGFKNKFFKPGGPSRLCPQSGTRPNFQLTVFCVFGTSFGCQPAVIRVKRALIRSNPNQLNHESLPSP
jgi:hypothetical protein